MDSAKGLIVIQTHLILASGKLVLQKNKQQDYTARETRKDENLVQVDKVRPLQCPAHMYLTQQGQRIQQQLSFTY